MKKVISMLNDYTVNIIYRNRALESVNQKNYPFVDYCQEQKMNMMRTIADVENAFYVLQDNKSKDDWSEEAMNMFQHIRHKLLDTANNVERLPQNLRCKGCRIDAMAASEYIADIISKASGKSA